MRILFIDDDEIHHFVIKKMLKRISLNVEPIFKNNGETALNYLKSLEAEQWPKVIVVDLKMPIMDGFELISKINIRVGSIKAQVCLIVLTASIAPQDRERATMNPIVLDYLEKPISEEVLEKKLIECRFKLGYTG